MPDERDGVLILYNIPRTEGGFAESDAGVLVEVQAVSQALAKLRRTCRTVGVARLADVPEALSAAPEPVVFNLVEGFHQSPEQANLVPALCDAFGKCCTGSPTPCLTLGLDKARTKAVLAGAGVPVPAGLVVPVGGRIPVAQLPPPPWIVKPLASDASEGIDGADSVFARAEARLRARVRALHERIGQPVVIEQMVGSRELNISVLQRGSKVEVLPLVEIDFSAFGPGKPRIVDYAAKWLAESFEYNHTPRIIPAPVSKAVGDRVRRISLRAWDAMGCCDYARVEFRLEDDGSIFVLEVNPNPDISPDAGLAAALEAAKIPYELFVETVVDNAMLRRKASSAEIHREVTTPRANEAHRARGVRGGASISAVSDLPLVRRTEVKDRDEILRFTGATRFFRANEIEIAREVLDDALANGPDGHYQSYTAELAGQAVGWVCFGPTPCAEGTFDIYWIVVSPEHQRAGVGRRLMGLAESEIARRGGRLAVVETAGRLEYDPTRRFYEKLGYRQSARVADFYAPGDDKIIYTKVIADCGLTIAD